MPILVVEIVTRPQEKLAPSLPKVLADITGEIFGSQAGGTWVRLHTLPADRYAEGPGESGEYFPVFVTVLKASLPSAEVLQAEVARLTRAIARACARPEENVHIVYQPAASGRVAFGGRLVRE